MRSEQEIFSELEKLCCSSGYAHVLAGLCFQDTFITIKDTLQAKDLTRINSRERLCRNEISVLFGLMVKGQSYLDPIDLKNITQLTKRTYELMEELHEAISQSFLPLFKQALEQDPNSNPFKTGLGQREPIFYSGESAYDFQFRDFALEKYRNDNAWFIQNKGYLVEEAVNILKAISEFQNRHLLETRNNLRFTPIDRWTLLPGFILTTQAIGELSGVSTTTVSSFLQSFCPPSDLNNANFKTINDFNYTNAYPLINLDNDSFLCLHAYGLTQAFYETPFFWMNEDASHKNKAAINRGYFTEEVAKSRLESVFGSSRVWANVLIRKTGSTQLAGEIDVLVLFGDKAIVLQAKSKKLTLQARKGDETALSRDFQLAVQESYDQGHACSQFLLSPDYEFLDKEGKKIEHDFQPSEIYIACIVADHYPALNFQARNFLSYVDDNQIAPPLVTDIFFLDVLCEFLNSPLLFLSYMNRRLRYFDQVMSSNEFAVLGYHLRRNLWLEHDNQFIWLEDDIAIELDMAILNRRAGLPGNATPKGLLTHVANPDSSLGKILRSIENIENPEVIDFGFLLLTFSQETIDQFNRGIKRICTLTQRDGRQHDFTMAIANTGITAHSNNAPMRNAAERLRGHCELRKYICKSDKWFGILLSGAPEIQIRNGLRLEYPFEFSEELEKKLETLPKVAELSEVKIHDFSSKKHKKLGRNDPCHCGSGKKFKMCCLN